MDEPTEALHEEVVHRALTRNGGADAGQVLCALLRLLRDRHRAAVAAFAARAYDEGFELPDARGSTVVESLRDLATSTAAQHSPNANGEREGNEPTGEYDKEAMALGMQVVADVLGELIPAWDSEGLGKAAAAPGGRIGGR